MLKPLGRMVLLLIAGLSVICIAFQTPKVQRTVLRAYVASRVVKLTDRLGTSGGTGFHMQAPSGKTYIITNRHVCDLSENGKLWVSQDTGPKIEKKIIYRSTVTDLCIVQPLKDISGLKIGKGVRIGEEVHAVGHPSLIPTTMTTGEIVGYDIVAVNYGISRGILYVHAVLTTIPILPGSSGSPMVNDLGEVVGVMFSGNSMNYWGDAIPLGYLRNFIKKY